MGHVYSSYFRSSDMVHTENDSGVSQAEIVKCDTTCDNTVMDKSTKNRRSKADAFSVTSADVAHYTNSTSSIPAACVPAAAAVVSSEGKVHHQPWFFANMTEEHWERLNMMCIVSPSSS